MPNVANAVARGVGDAAHPVEALQKVGYTGFGLQRTQFSVNAAGPLPMVAPVAGAGAGAVNLPGAAGGLPKLMNPAVVQADFATRFAAGARLNQAMTGGLECIRFNAPIPGGGGWDVPIESTAGTFEHMVVVREAASVIEEFQAADPVGIFVAAFLHANNSRMPNGDNKHFMHNLHDYFSTATVAQLNADGIGWIKGFVWSGYDTLSGGTPGFCDGPGGPIILGDPKTRGDKHAEGILFIDPKYESPEASPAAMAGWSALNTLIISWGGADGRWQQTVAPFQRDMMYFSPLVLSSWKKIGDRNDYPAIFKTYSYITRLKMSWRCGGGGGRNIARQNTEMQLMAVIPQRPVTTHDFPRGHALPVLPPPPPGAQNLLLPTRSVAQVRIPQ